MKKTIAATLILAGALTLSAAPAIDGFGKITPSGNLAEWTLNMSPAQAKTIKITPVKNEAGQVVVTVDGTAFQKNVPLRHAKGILCKAGDKIVVTFDVKTAGSIKVSLHKYGDKGLMPSQTQAFRLMNRKTSVKFEFVLTEPAGNKLFRVNPVLEFPGKVVSTAENLKIELIPAAEQK